MRAISLEADLAQDSIRNLLKGVSARPHDRTLDALARAFHVPTTVLLGEEQIPDDLPAAAQPPISQAEADHAAAVRQRRGMMAPELAQSGAARHELRQQVSSAVKSAVASGVNPAQAVRVAVQAAVLAAVAVGAYEGEMAALLDAIA